MKILIKFILPFILFYSCDKDVSVTPKPDKLPDNFIAVTSNPSNALIFLDERNTGRYTPDTLIYVAEGNHVITLKLPYYNDTTVSSQVNAGSVKNIFVDFTDNPSMRGSIAFNSDPVGVNVILNDSIDVGITPTEIIDLLPGEYIIDYSLNGFRDRSFTQIVESGQQTGAYAVLTDTTVWVDYSTFNSGLSSNNLNTVVIDRNNIVWIGSDDMGLFSFDGREFKSYPEFSSLVLINKIISLNVDSNNKLFIGTEEGLVIKDEMNWNHFNKDNSGIPNNRIQEVQFDIDGNIWIATLRGLVKYDGVEWVVYDQDNSNIASHVLTSLSVDKFSENIWMGTSDSGLIKFDRTNFNNFNTANSGILTNYVSSLKIDDDGIVWITNLPSNNLNGGISALGGASSWLTGFGNTQVDLLTNIFIDSKNHKWIASNFGIVKFEYIGIKTFFTVNNSGLRSNLITDISEDNAGIIWITTSGGGLTKYKGERF